MKKVKLIIYCMVMTMLCITPIQGRAGGGGSGGSGGGSGSGGSSSSGSSSSGDSSDRMIIGLGFMGLMTLGAGGSAYYFRYQVYKKKKISKTLLKKLDDIDEFWDEHRIQKQVEEIFYQAQSAWTNKNLEVLKPYVTEDLFENWRMKIDWMDVRRERNILDKVKLLSSHIVSVYDSKVNEHDMFWVCIRGKMVDFKIDEVEELIIEGDKKSHEFFEYWKFIRKENIILLDEVRQKDELDIQTLVDLSEELHDEDNQSGLRNY